jgi:hypothetical protein
LIWPVTIVSALALNDPGCAIVSPDSQARKQQVIQALRIGLRGPIWGM